MMQYENVASPKINTEKYISFKGADFSTDPSKVNAYRSPMPLNLIPDAGGFPEKRPGTRTVCTFPNRLNGMFSLETKDGTKYIAHAGDKIYLWNMDGTEPVLLRDKVFDGRSCGIVENSKLWILTGGEYLCYDGETIVDVTSIATVPETSIARTPAGKGTRLYPVNLLTPKRINSFRSDGSTTYQLEAFPIEKVYKVVVNGNEVSNDKFTVDLEKGKVNFISASTVPAATGNEDNVQIHFERTVKGYSDRILKCCYLFAFNLGSSNRIFFSGNPNFKNLDWHCEHNDPTFIADTSFCNVGSSDNAIMGYLNMGENMAIIKEDRGQDTSVFLRSSDILSDGTVAFKIKRAVTSIGGVSPYCIANLRDDPLFLSKSGVFAITTVAITQERTIKPRSQFIDARLTKEKNLNEAVSCVCKDMLYLAVNNHVYVADSKQQAFKESLADNYGYEWYYWEGIPARVIWEHNEGLYFGGKDGHIRKLNTDIETMERYSDDGKPITAQWVTRSETHGDFMRVKTMPRGGSGIMCKPYTSSSVEIIIRTNKDFGTLAKKASMSIFDFSDLDFANFSFNTDDSPQIIPINKKTKKYKTIQFTIKNGKLNQGFGIFGIIMRYRFGGFVKR